MIRRLRKALANPAFVSQWAIERLMARVWTFLFYIEGRWHGVAVGRDVDIYGRPLIRRGLDSAIVIGDRVQLISSSWRSSTASCSRTKLRTYYPTARIVFGNRSGMTGGSIIARSKAITIGEGCMLAPNVTIFDSDFHIAWPPERRHDTWETDIDRDVTLERNVWVGTGAIILKGVTIGENSVIAAGSVVVSNIPPNCVAGGNPARVLKTFV